MTLEQAMQSAQPMKNFGESQFIVGEPDDCEVITMYGGIADAVYKINDKRVLAHRSFSPTSYITNQQGSWANQNEPE